MGEALKLRDRLTHPKKPADLTVSDEEILQVRTAHCWVLNSLSDVANHVHSLEQHQQSTLERLAVPPAEVLPGDLKFEDA